MSLVATHGNACVHGLCVALDSVGLACEEVGSSFIKKVVSGALDNGVSQSVHHVRATPAVEQNREQKLNIDAERKKTSSSSGAIQGAKI